MHFFDESFKSAFLYTIRNIIFLCPKKEMFRIYTRWNIAFMKHLKMVWDFAIENLIG